MSIRVLNPEKPVIRRSLAESLLACTEFQGEDSEAANFGSAWHLFHASWSLRCKELGVESLPPAEVSVLAAEAFRPGSGIPEYRREEFVALCHKFTDTHSADLGALIDVERTLTYDAGWALLTCTVDRLDRLDDGDRDDEPTALRIVDRKSGFADAFGKVSHAFQRDFYSQMAFLNFPSVSHVEFEIDPVRAAMPQEPTVYERGDLDAWWEETVARVREAWEIREGRHGKPTGCSACQFCAQRFTCGSAIEPWRSAPETIEQAEEQFMDLLRLVEAVSLRKKALASFFSDREAVEAAGYEVGWLQPRHESFHVTGSAVDVKAALDDQLLDGDAVLKVDAAKIKNPGLQNTLIVLGLGERSLSAPEFNWRRIAPAKARA